MTHSIPIATFAYIPQNLKAQEWNKQKDSTFKPKDINNYINYKWLKHLN